jgi:hypothetical protein
MLCLKAVADYISSVHKNCLSCFQAGWQLLFATVYARFSLDACDCILDMSTRKKAGSSKQASVSAADPGNSTRKTSSSGLTEQQLLDQYRLVKQHTAARRYTEALYLGWQLLQQVYTALQSVSSRCLQELLVGAGLNVVVCTAEAGPCDTSTLQDLNTALGRLLATLRYPNEHCPLSAVAIAGCLNNGSRTVNLCCCREQPSASAAQHAGVLVKCLLKVSTGTSAAEAASPYWTPTAEAAAHTFAAVLAP